MTIYLASKPDRGTDGRFLSENIEDLDFMTDSEKLATMTTFTWLVGNNVVVKRTLKR